MQEEEARRWLVREVAYDLQRRVKQELAFPAVIHFYCWLLQGTPAHPASVAGLPLNSPLVLSVPSQHAMPCDNSHLACLLQSFQPSESDHSR